MKRTIKKFLGLILSLSVVITGLQIGGFEAKAATTYTFNYNCTTKKLYPSGGGGDLDMSTPVMIPNGDAFKLEEINYIPYIDFGFSGKGHLFRCSVTIYSMNPSNDGLISPGPITYSKEPDSHKVGGGCSGAGCLLTVPIADYNCTITATGNDYYILCTGAESNKITFEVFTSLEAYMLYSIEGDDEPEEQNIKTMNSTHNHSYTWQITQKGSPEKDQIEQRVCSSCGAKGETRTTSAYTFFLAEANNELLVKNTPAGETAEITTKVFNVFPKSLMEAIAARRDIDVVFTYKYEGKNIQVKIPAGAEVDTICDYYGPVKMMSLYGYTEIATFPGEIVASTIPELVNAQAGATVTLTGKDAYCKEDMLAISERKDVNVDLEVTYDGKKYLIHIPAGTAIDLSCDWYGPAKLMSLYAYDEK